MTDYMNWTPPSMDEFRQLKKREEEERRQGDKRNQQANLYAMLTAALVGAGGRGGAQMASQSAQKGVDMVQYQNEMRMADLKNEFIQKTQLRKLEMDEKQFQMQADAYDRVLDAKMKKAKFDMDRAKVIEDSVDKKYVNEMKYTTDERTSAMDFIKRISSDYGDMPVVGETIGKVGEHFAKKISEFIPKAEEGRATATSQKALLKSAGEAGGEAVDVAAQDIGYLTPAQEEARKRADVLYEQTIKSNETAQKTNEFNYNEAVRKSKEGDEKSQAFLDLVNKGSFSTQYSPQAQMEAIQDYQDYKGNEKQISLMGRTGGGGGGGGGTKAPAPTTTTGVAKTYEDWDKKTGAEQTSYLLPLINAFQYEQPEEVDGFIQSHSGTDPAVLKMMVSQAFANSGQLMDDRGMLATMFDNVTYTNTDRQGNQQTFFKDATGKEQPFKTTDDKRYKDAATQKALESGLVKSKNYWVQRGSMADDYVKSPTQFIKEHGGSGTSSNVNKEPERPNTGTSAIPDITSTSWQQARSEVDYMFANYDVAQIKKIISNPEGARNLITDDNGNPYPEDVFNYIISILTEDDRLK